MLDGFYGPRPETPAALGHWLQAREADCEQLDKKDLLPMFVQHNYIAAAAPIEDLEALSAAADSIADADMMENRARVTGDFSSQSNGFVAGCVAPVLLTTRTNASAGRRPRISFPDSLGKMSKVGKARRQKRSV